MRALTEQLQLGQNKVFLQKIFRCMERVYIYRGELYFGPLHFLIN
jgi:hypothetical protein